MRVVYLVLALVQGSLLRNALARRVPNVTASVSSGDCSASGAAHRAATAETNNTDVISEAAKAAANCSGTSPEPARTLLKVTTSVNATGHIKPSCASACDSCFATHLMECYATCHTGLQAYCNTVCTTSTTCNVQWSAGPGYGDGITKKFCDGMLDADGCPTQNYER